jgi:hypothetical protein
MLETEQSDCLISLAEIIQGLSEKWSPHDAQIPIGKALFYEGKKNIFVCAARNFGKTELAAYCTWRWALENPGSENYIIEPFLIQGREILWASQRLQKFGPEELIESINNTELRITFKNKSFIKLAGSDNEAALAGIKPKGLIIYDEVKDHRKSAIMNMEPNRAAFDAPAIFIGSPPEFHCYYVELKEMAEKSKDWAYFHGPTSSNPHISRQWLQRKKDELISMGEEETWLRDYEGLFVIGGKRSIFPQFLKLQFKPLELPKDLNKWTLIMAFDPAASSVFGVLFALFNPYSKQVIVFDEIYETEPTEMTAGKMYQKVEAKIKEYRGKVRDIRWIYDEAARYFMQEIYEIKGCDWSMEPSRKAQVGVDGYISIVRTVLNKGLLVVTENCKKFIWEMQQYQKDEKGRIPKENDHLINAFQYKLQALGFNTEDEMEPKGEDPFLKRRFVGIEDELPSNNNLIDFDDVGRSTSFEEF